MGRKKKDLLRYCVGVNKTMLHMCPPEGAAATLCIPLACLVWIEKVKFNILDFVKSSLVA